MRKRLVVLFIRMAPCRSEALPASITPLVMDENC